MTVAAIAIPPGQKMSAQTANASVQSGAMRGARWFASPSAQAGESTRWSATVASLGIAKMSGAGVTNLLHPPTSKVNAVPDQPKRDGRATTWPARPRWGGAENPKRSTNLPASTPQIASQLERTASAPQLPPEEAMPAGAATLPRAVPKNIDPSAVHSSTSADPKSAPTESAGVRQLPGTKEAGASTPLPVQEKAVPSRVQPCASAMEAANSRVDPEVENQGEPLVGQNPQTADREKPFTQGDPPYQLKSANDPAALVAPPNAPAPVPQTIPSASVAISAALDKIQAPAVNENSDSVTAPNPGNFAGRPKGANSTVSLLPRAVSVQPSQSAGVSPESLGTLTLSHFAVPAAAAITARHAPAGAGNTRSTEEPFAALDSAQEPAAPVWRHIGSHTAEAGFQDPVLGWVGVRAQALGSGVHATVVPASADAAQSLASHFSGLGSYLVEHRAPVETLALATPERDSTSAGTRQESNEQRQGPDPGKDASPRNHLAHEVEAVTTSVSPSRDVTVSGNGTYISVMA